MGDRDSSTLFSNLEKEKTHTAVFLLKFSPIPRGQLLMKPMYACTSRSCAVTDLDPALLKALAAHSGIQLLGDLETAVTACCQIHRVRTARPSLLSRALGSGDRDHEHNITALITTSHLIIARSGAKYGITVISAPLRDIGFQHIHQEFLSRASANSDSGISLHARWSGFPEAGSYFLPLAADAAGEAFGQALTRAVADAKLR
ncbi:hypothetical protein [Streptomyces sp. NPDC001139]